jgi:hypothetical protein
LIIWTDQLEWSAGPRRWRKIGARYRARAKRFGWVRVVDEILYFAVYHVFLRRRDARRIRALIEGVVADGGRPRSMDEVEQVRADIREIRPDDIQAPEILKAIRDDGLDALFSVCVSVLLPEPLITTPRLGAYLWHEGITPEYRGVHSAFWALANGDPAKLGYTLLKMNMKVDGGDVFVQGTVRDIDPVRDPPNYIGHKAIVDSLDETELFLKALEREEQVPLELEPSEDRISALVRIGRRRWRARLGSGRGK